MADDYKKYLHLNQWRKNILEDKQKMS